MPETEHDHILWKNGFLITLKKQHFSCFTHFSISSYWTITGEENNNKSLNLMCHLFSAEVLLGFAFLHKLLSYDECYMIITCTFQRMLLKSVPENGRMKIPNKCNLKWQALSLNSFTRCLLCPALVVYIRTLFPIYHWFMRWTLHILL